MHISVIATDFDGTVAEGDRLAPEAGRALRRWREAGRTSVLVSGRPFEFLRDLQERERAFDLIVAENGAVLYNPYSDEMRLPFGQVPDELVSTLAQLGIPLWRGIAIAGTTLPYDDAVWVTSRELGLAVHVAINRSEVMLLPPGASKGAGLLHLLQNEGLSPRNLLAFGDAENDLSLLQVAEVKVAVANAVQDLQTMADHVTPEAGPAGVADFVDRYLLGGKALDFPIRGAHQFDLDAAHISLNAYDLVDREILIAGGSGYSKSWLACRLAAPFLLSVPWSRGATGHQPGLATADRDRPEPGSGSVARPHSRRADTVCDRIAATCVRHASPPWSATLDLDR
jgi:hydroxymethylpyrimidine pyrophosphatase-like HAD family hydrolase